jgi:Leucine-rich repeat (LRR) protein
MKFLIRKILFVAAFALIGWNLSYAVLREEPSAGRVKAQIKQSEKEAIEALTRLGVPLQRDTRGTVRWIEAVKGELTDEAMQYLPKLPELEWLEIGGGKVSPSGIVHLKDCTSLKRLYAHDIMLKGEELKWLSNLANLEAISLQRTGIDGKMLKNISNLQMLTVLNLSGNEIQNSDMEQIAHFKGLEVLALAETKITGAGISKLEGMKSLNELNITGCQIVDSDLESFLSMPNLRIVYAMDCLLSDMAVINITTRFPMLAIFRH